MGRKALNRMKVGVSAKTTTNTKKVVFGHVRSPLLTNASEMVDGIKPETNKRAAAGDDEVLPRHRSNHVAASRAGDVTRPALTASGRL